MKINIKATGVALTPAISDYVRKKISSVEKFLLSGDIVVQVEVGKSTKHHKSGEVFMAEAHLTGNGLDLYAISEQTDLYAAIDLVKDELVRELTHLKGKKETLYRKGAQIAKNMMKGINFFKKRR